MTKSLEKLFLRTLCIPILLFNQNAWCSQSEWNLTLQTHGSRPTTHSSAHLRSTRENILLISTLSTEIPLNGEVAFSECHYPVDLSRFTDHPITQMNRVMKRLIKPQGRSLHPNYVLKTELDAEDQADFVYQLTTALSTSDYNSILIDDPSGTSRCMVSHEDSALAIAGPKIDPKNVYLLKNGNQEKISLFDWAQEKIWNYRKKSTLKSITEFLEWVNQSAQAHLPIGRSQPKPDNCQSDSPQSEPYP